MAKSIIMLIRRYLGCLEVPLFVWVVIVVFVIEIVTECKQSQFLVFRLGWEFDNSKNE